MSTVVVLRDVLRYVRGASEADLAAISREIKSSRTILSAEAAAKVTEGARVTLDNLKPQYLEGLTGIVTQIEQHRRGNPRATVTLDLSSTRRLAQQPMYSHLATAESYALRSVPLGCCTVDPT